jgi:hypothetical protein
MNKSNHTELPWGIGDIDEDTDSEFFTLEVMAGPNVICLVYSTDGQKENQTANAALIVHRVNNWDKLVEALEELFLTTQNEMVSRNLPLEWHKDTAMGRAQAALKLAKEGI